MSHCFYSDPYNLYFLFYVILKYQVNSNGIEMSFITAHQLGYCTSYYSTRYPFYNLPSINFTPSPNNHYIQGCRLVKKTCCCKVTPALGAGDNDGACFKEWIQGITSIVLIMHFISIIITYSVYCWTMKCAEKSQDIFTGILYSSYVGNLNKSSHNVALFFHSQFNLHCIVVFLLQIVLFVI